MAYAKSCLIVLVFAALLLLSSHGLARELADQTEQSVQPGGVEEDLHKDHKHKHHHRKHDRRHHKKPGHGGAGEDGKENTESELEDEDN